MTNPPFTREKADPPFHLRPFKPGELEQLERMRDSYTKLFQDDCSASSPCDNVARPSGE